MQKNGEAIYNTRITSNYHSNNVWFTASKNGKTLYALYALPEGEKIPASIEWEGNIPTKNSRIKLLASGQKVKWAIKDNKVILTVPDKYVGGTEPLAFRLEISDK